MSKKNHNKKHIAQHDCSVMPTELFTDLVAERIFSVGAFQLSETFNLVAIQWDLDLRTARGLEIAERIIIDSVNKN